ncbi:glycoprotein 3-alpha-L-fucosyltransferase A-like [Mytilus californianus]|uniref:glycoprotein 3-alpha-L-fucosyltransferase A-like n=1 Tax=Mytilus californianus TaxID=6549 RepID=UPI002245565B|nr:glycoprotein 3-alpha-L-fucosyltransferase A-like [Mytilus californianus]
MWILWTIVNLIFTNYPKFNLRKMQPSPKNDSSFNFTILMYAPPIYPKNHYKINFLRKCVFDNCKISFDRSLLRYSDAVIFFYKEITFKPPTKFPNQTWILTNFEAPNFKSPERYIKLFKFDWTMSYRQDSDVYVPYGVIKESRMNNEKNYSSIYSMKSYDVAWIVSNCKTRSRRDEYVEKLSEYIDIDIYGKCGWYSCRGSIFQCKKRLSERYKFMLAFENSLCKDYLTEKIFHLYRDNIDIIPVVRGAPNTVEHLPNNTFVLVSDFKSPKDLADRLKIIGGNEALYTEMLKQKDKYTAFSDPNEETGIWGVCRTCKLLNNNYQSNKTVDIERWLSGRSCILPSDL